MCSSKRSWGIHHRSHSSFIVPSIYHVEGENAYFDFYNPEEWERLQLGVFGPEYDDRLSDDQRQSYKEHMRIQMAAAKKWRKEILNEAEDEKEEHDFREQSKMMLKDFPPLVACASDKIPTVNQILRRRRRSPTSASSSYSSQKLGSSFVSQISLTRKGRSPWNEWEYDYINGRSVPGDGRIDYDKAFPPEFVVHKRVTLNSVHAKQMCWEESGGSWGRVYEEVARQAEEYCEKMSKSDTSRKREREAFVERFEATMTTVTSDASVESSTNAKLTVDSSKSHEGLVKVLDKRHGNRRSKVRLLVTGARNVRRRFQRRGPKKKSNASSARPARFSFRRNR